jgi:hypothetical protein
MYEFTNVSEVCTASIIRALAVAVQTSETSVNSYQSTWCYNPADSLLHTHHRENLKSCMGIHGEGEIVLGARLSTTA